MMLFGITVPSLPPSNPWEAYIWTIVLITLSRIVILWGPVDGLRIKYGDERKSLFQGLMKIRKATGLKGIGGLLFGEILLLIIPLTLAFSARFVFGPPDITWPSSQNMLIPFSAFFIVWFILEFRQILIIRESINAVLQPKTLIHTMGLHASVVDRAIRTFGWSREQIENLSNMGVVFSPPEAETDSNILKEAITKYWKFHPSAIFARKATKEAAKFAGKKIDDKTQKGFNALLDSIHSWKRVRRGFAYNMMPLIILYSIELLYRGT